MRLFWLILVLGVILAVLGAQIGPTLFNSYVLVRIGGLAIETSLVWLLVALLLAFVLLHVALWAWHLPSNALRKQLEKRAQAQLEIGMMAMTEGDFSKAEKALAKSADTSSRPALNYVAAARAAQAKGDDVKRDEYLTKAEDAAANSQPIVVSRAQLLLAADQPRQALALLHTIKKPSKPKVLELLARCYERMEMWVELDALAPKLLKAKLIDRSQADRYALEADRSQLGAATNAAELQQAWTGLAKTHRKNPVVLAEYALHAIGFGETETLEKDLRGAINKRWSDELVLVYGQLPGGDPSSRLKHAEKWLSAQPNNYVLHLTVARLAAQCQDQRKARQHYETSFERQPTPEAAAELARLLKQEGDRDPALYYYEQAVALFQGGPIDRAPVDKLISSADVIDIATSQRD